MCNRAARELPEGATLASITDVVDELPWNCEFAAGVDPDDERIAIAFVAREGASLDLGFAQGGFE